ncbi:cell surface hydrolase, membrane-bound [Liquorilactobacillus aquaticus DSM 21051]|uniref:Cell surface hydrolase, membrane-bound n=1 Tax=Liquorilactobacillus aquaticus DSM 21051 TaxID=1423725 RepID=A0A0R2D699_9LACO|nr:alpha/beta hydrolase [Liquorilactobacillus aquaticus]KRM96121.1 cell surface hydrolase, membrane-bound [Liquorilactobacillus aquaticus DSM 21051]
MKKEKKIVKRCIGACLAILFLGGMWQARQASFLRGTKIQRTGTPTLFIPGYMGNRVSFGGMIFRLDHYGLGTKTMIIHVSADGKIHFNQKASLKSKNPLIQVLFENNRNEQVEAVQLGKVLIELKRKYNVPRVNLVGHSSGGNIVYDYLINKTSKKSQAPQVIKFVNIATTFPGLKESGKKLDPELSILNIAGNIWGQKTDGGIPLNKDLYLEKIVKPYVKDYRAKVIKGSPLTAYHSMLHENGEVDREIAMFLFERSD